MLPAVATAQGAVDPEHGLIFVDQKLRGLGSVKRVLIIGAHPDDEDTSLLTVLVRGRGADAAYLSLNRGEGGQNLIGPELGVGLGLLRTGELLAARRLDGARQFFTRAYDFGYSKSVDETFRFWPKDSLLADVVYVIRQYRPQVIVSIFAGRARDGHGQHQAAGRLAREAFDAAGDPKRFPGQLDAGLQPWTPLKLYRSTRFDTEATTLTVETGELDLFLGRSYHQIAMASRSQHRSQDMGRIESLGPMRTQLGLLESRVGGAAGRADTSLFDGVNTSFQGLLMSAALDGATRGSLTEALDEYARRLESARAALFAGSGRLVGELARALAALRRAIGLTETVPAVPDLRFALREDEVDLEAALAAAAGVIVEAFASDDLIVPGRALDLEMQIWNGGGEPIRVRRLAVHTPPRWGLEPIEPEVVEVLSGELGERRFRLSVPEDAEPSKPYFLRAPRSEGFYTWPADTRDRATPLGAPQIEVEAEIGIAGQSVRVSAEAFHRFADQARGEVRRPVFVVPEVAVGLAPRTTVWPLDRRSALAYVVKLRSEAEGGVSGRVWLEVPEGWVVHPAQTPVTILGPGRAASVEFEVTPAARTSAGTYSVRAWVETASGGRHGLGYSVIDYPHVRRSLLIEEAVARIEAFDLSVDHGVQVAYVQGAGDAVAEAIATLGVRVELLDERAIAGRDLSKFDVVVLGIRAYETNPALTASNDRFLEWVRSGGVLITQYQQYDYFNGGYAPYPMRARFPHDRVSDESVAVTMLTPDHVLFNRPNRISELDFEGWVQERGLYYPYEWDERYEPLLEMADPGEAPKRGGLLVARHGEGLYVYVGLSLFRQLPAGVPGAYRLLANLLSLR
jgi:LmbE family N-acetylglucosaminyl deacetylase